MGTSRLVAIGLRAWQAHANRGDINTATDRLMGRWTAPRVEPYRSLPNRPEGDPEGPRVPLMPVEQALLRAARRRVMRIRPVPQFDNADEILSAAGIDAGTRTFDFPRLSNDTPADAPTQVLRPSEVPAPGTEFADLAAFAALVAACIGWRLAFSDCPLDSEERRPSRR